MNLRSLTFPNNNICVGNGVPPKWVPTHEAHPTLKQSGKFLGSWAHERIPSPIMHNWPKKLLEGVG